MPPLEFFIVLWAVAFFLNFFWEVWHSQLYTTCLPLPLPKVIRLLTGMSFRDAVWITLSYALSVWIFGTANPFTNKVQLIVFVVWLLLFSWVAEVWALKNKRWEYAPSMPIVFGVGLSPFVELAITGVASISITLVIT